MTGEPWFRRFGGFGYRPITWQGVVVVAAQAGVFLPCAFVFLRYTDKHPSLGWTAATIGVIAYFALFAVVVWRTETNYQS